MYVTVFNPSDSPVVVSEQGHTVGGGELGTVNTLDDVAKWALAQGYVRQMPEPEEGVANSDMAAVYEETADRQARYESAKAMEKQDLADAASEYDESYADLNKTELVALFSDNEDMELPGEDADSTTTSETKEN